MDYTSGPKTKTLFVSLGISIQFFCTPRPEEPIEHVTACLQALHILLDSSFARSHIADDQVYFKLFLLAIIQFGLVFMCVIYIIKFVWLNLFSKLQ